jgi:hypothetical protein
MKFKQYLSESSENDNWEKFRDWVTDVGRVKFSHSDRFSDLSVNAQSLVDLGISDFRYLINFKDLSLDPGIRTIELKFKKSNFKSYKNIFTQSKPMNLMIIDVSQVKIEIKDWSQLFDADEIYIHGACKVTSWNGLDKIKLDKLEMFDVHDDSDIECGFLKLFKTSIKKLDIENKNKEMSHAAKIVAKHIEGDKSIADCMDDLIEAGLKKYAK